jgi:head-tail adaptor
MGMQAGKLRHLVTVMRHSSTQDSTGSEVLSFTVYTKVWAWIEPFVGSARAGREVFSANQLVGLDYTRIHLRFLVGLTPKDQIVYGTRVFDIQAVNNRDEEDYELELIAVERQTNQ